MKNWDGRPKVKASALITLACFVVQQMVSPSVLLAAEQAVPGVPAIEIPAHMGSVEASGLLGSEKPTIIQIQDAHGNYDAQKNIRNILEHLAKRGDIDMVLLEGGKGLLHPEVMNFVPTRPSLNLEIADTLARQSELSGAEIFLLDRYQSGKTMPAFGIENASAYRANREAFQNVLRARERSGIFLQGMDEQIDRLTAPYMNSTLKSFLHDYEAYESRRMEMAAWLRQVRTLTVKHLGMDPGSPAHQNNWPMLARYYRLQDIESKMDPVRVKNDAAALQRKLESLGVPAGVIKDWNKAIDLSAGAPVETDRLINALEHVILAVPSDFSFVSYPYLKAWIQFQVFESELKGEGLFGELEELEARLSSALARTEAEKKLLSLFRDYRELKKLFALELTRNDYLSIQKNVKALTPSAIAGRFSEVNTGKRVRDIRFEHLDEIDSLYSAALDFYAGALDRDRLMAENILQTMRAEGLSRAAVVTGGFHSQGMRDYFESKGFSYALVSPRIHEIGDTKAYVRAMLDEDIETVTSHVADILVEQLPDTQLEMGGLAHLTRKDAVIYRVVRDVVENAGARSELRSMESRRPEYTPEFLEALLESPVTFSELERQVFEAYYINRISAPQIARELFNGNLQRTQAARIRTAAKADYFRLYMYGKPVNLEALGEEPFQKLGFFGNGIDGRILRRGIVSVSDLLNKWPDLATADIFAEKSFEAVSEILKPWKLQLDFGTALKSKVPSADLEAIGEMSAGELVGEMSNAVTDSGIRQSHYLKMMTVLNVQKAKDFLNAPVEELIKAGFRMGDLDFTYKALLSIAARSEVRAVSRGTDAYEPEFASAFLNSKVMKLSDQEKTVFEKRYIKKQKVDEIADEFKVSSPRISATLRDLRVKADYFRAHIYNQPDIDAARLNEFPLERAGYFSAEAIADWKARGILTLKDLVTRLLELSAAPQGTQSEIERAIVYLEVSNPNVNLGTFLNISAKQLEQARKLMVPEYFKLENTYRMFLATYDDKAPVRTAAELERINARNRSILSLELGSAEDFFKLTLRDVMRQGFTVDDLRVIVEVLKNQSIPSRAPLPQVSKTESLQVFRFLPSTEFALDEAGITTVGELVDHTPMGLRDLSGVNDTQLAEIRQKLGTFNLVLRGETAARSEVRSETAQPGDEIKTAAVRQVLDLKDGQPETLETSELADIVRDLVTSGALKDYAGLQVLLTLFSAGPATGKGALMSATFLAEEEGETAPYQDLVDKFVLFHTRAPRVDKKNRSEKNGRAYYFIKTEDLKRLAAELGEDVLVIREINREVQALARKTFILPNVEVPDVAGASQIQPGDVVLSFDSVQGLLVVQRGETTVPLTGVTIPESSAGYFFTEDKIEKIENGIVYVGRKIKGIEDTFSSGKLTILEGGYEWFKWVNEHYPDVLSMFLSPFRESEFAIRSANMAWIRENFTSPEDVYTAFEAMTDLIKAHKGEISIPDSTDYQSAVRAKVDAKAPVPTALVENTAVILNDADFIVELNQLRARFGKPELASEDHDLARALAFEVQKRLFGRDGVKSFRSAGDRTNPYDRILEGVLQILDRNSDYGAENVLPNPFGFTEEEKNRNISELSDQFARRVFLHVINGVRRSEFRADVNIPALTAVTETGLAVSIVENVFDGIVPVSGILGIAAEVLIRSISKDGNDALSPWTSFDENGRKQLEGVLGISGRGTQANVIVTEPVAGIDHGLVSLLGEAGQGEGVQVILVGANEQQRQIVAELNKELKANKRSEVRLAKDAVEARKIADQVTHGRAVIRAYVDASAIGKWGEALRKQTADVVPMTRRMYENLKNGFAAAASRLAAFFAISKRLSASA